MYKIKNVSVLWMVRRPVFGKHWSSVKCDSKTRLNNILLHQLTELGDGNVENETQKLRDFIAEIKTMPIAVNQSDANEQHYEASENFDFQNFFKKINVLMSYCKVEQFFFARSQF